MVKKLEVSRSTINLKKDLVKLLDKFPRLKKILIAYKFLQRLRKNIKDVCEGSGSKFKLNFISHYLTIIR